MNTIHGLIFCLSLFYMSFAHAKNPMEECSDFRSKLISSGLQVSFDVISTKDGQKDETRESVVLNLKYPTIHECWNSPQHQLFLGRDVTLQLENGKIFKTMQEVDYGFVDFWGPPSKIFPRMTRLWMTEKVVDELLSAYGYSHFKYSPENRPSLNTNNEITGSFFYKYADGKTFPWSVVDEVTQLPLGKALRDGVTYSLKLSNPLLLPFE